MGPGTATGTDSASPDADVDPAFAVIAIRSVKENDESLKAPELQPIANGEAEEPTEHSGVPNPNNTLLASAKSEKVVDAPLVWVPPTCEVHPDTDPLKSFSETAIV